MVTLQSSKSRVVTAGFAILALTVSALAAPSPAAAAADIGYSVAGSFQKLLGCSDEWRPDCSATAMTQAAADSNLWQVTLPVPAGQWEFKIAAGGNMNTSYGLNGSDANIPLSVAADTDVTFVFDDTSHQIGYTVDGLRDAYGEGDSAGSPNLDAGAGQQFYFVMTDRFANGDPVNDTSYGAGHEEDGTPIVGTSSDADINGYDPSFGYYYQGGDLKGIQDKLAYIKSLGTTAIWLSPPFTNRAVQGNKQDGSSAGYHGYWITDFAHIDPHYGGDDAMKDLIKAAKDEGMSVYFDIIANHTADVIQNGAGSPNNYPYKYMSDVPYKDTDGKVIDPAEYVNATTFPDIDTASYPYAAHIPDDLANAKWPDWLNDITNYHNRGEGATSAENEEVTIYGDFNGLDDVFTEKPEVVKGMIAIYQAWMDWGIAGFRIDTVKHVDFEFWQQFTAAIQAYQGSGAVGVDSDFFEFGEVYSGSVTDTAPYVRDTDMNATLDFPFAFGAQRYLKGGSGSDLANLFAADDYYTTDHSDAQDQVTFLGNHDMGRLAYLLTTSTFGAGVKDNLPERVALGNDLEFLSRGQPVVYYGDEQGFDGGGNDWHSRQTMFESPAFAADTLVDGRPITDAWGPGSYNTTADSYEQIAALSQLRKGHPALDKGAQINLGSQYSAYAFARVDATEKVENIVAINSGTLPVTDLTVTPLTAGADFQVYYKSGSGGFDKGRVVEPGLDGRITLEVPALGAIVLEPVGGETVSKPRLPAAEGPGGNFIVTPGVDLDGSGVNTLVQGLAPITASAPADAWSQTTFSVRLIGDSTW
ncbi:MAG: DUF3372 domain-containing protein, partial [Propionibacteriaceae bacterium]|nr:DUF3372 domain-containing protein [Propionibacteriaceae bacterium]